MLNLDKDQYTIAVFFNIKKAFHTIDHNILIKKLQNSGVGNNTKKLLKKIFGK